MAIAAAQSPGIPIPGGATITLPPLAVDGMRARTAPIGPEDVVEEDNGDYYGIEQADKDFACSCVEFLLFLVVVFKPGQGHDQDMMSPVAVKMTPVPGVVSKAIIFHIYTKR